MSISTANVTTTTANTYVSTGNTAVTFLSLTNYTSSPVTANIYVVPTGDTAGVLNIAAANIQLTAEDTFQFYASNEKLILADGDSIQVNASTDNAVGGLVSYTSI